MKSFSWVQLFTLSGIESIHINNNSASGKSCERMWKSICVRYRGSIELEKERLVELHFYAKILNYRGSGAAGRRARGVFHGVRIPPLASSSRSLSSSTCPLFPYLSPIGMMHICPACHIFATLPSSILSVVCPFLTPLPSPPPSPHSPDDFKWLQGKLFGVQVEFRRRPGSLSLFSTV